MFCNALGGRPCSIAAGARTLVGGGWGVSPSVTYWLRSYPRLGRSVQVGDCVVCYHVGEAARRRSTSSSSCSGSGDSIVSCLYSVRPSRRSVPPATVCWCYPPAVVALDSADLVEGEQVRQSQGGHGRPSVRGAPRCGLPRRLRGDRT